MGDRLREIRARRAAITPGKWKLIRYDRGGGRIYVAGEHDGGAEGERRALVLDTDTREPDGVATAYHEGDREFFFEAPEDVDWLIAEVEALRALLGEAAPHVRHRADHDECLNLDDDIALIELACRIEEYLDAVGGGSDG